MNITMLELPHAAVGATIAVLIPNPFIAIPLALGSHFAMDLFPHWNPHTLKELKRYGHLTSGTTTILWIDSLAALSSGLVLARFYFPHYLESANVLLCCFAAVLPDVISIPLLFFHKKWRWLKNFSQTASEFQFRLPAPLGIYTQIGVLVACLFLILSNI